jgi:hypothetical protein
LSCPPSSGGCRGWNAYWAYWYILNKGGVITEDCFSYTANDRVPCSDKCEDWQEKLMPISGYKSAGKPDKETLQNLLIEYGPVVTEMAVYGDFGGYEGGIYEHPGEEPTSDINHQVVIVGYNDDPGYWICKNSWGTDWGENGWFKIAYGDCQIEHSIIYVNFSPAIARITGQYYVKPGEKIVFMGDKSESLTSTITSYSWSFGDGTTADGMLPRHTYLEEGRYIVKLTVTDAKGNIGETKITVYVDDSPPEIEILKPKDNHLYVYGEEKREILTKTIVVGNISIIAVADDDLSGVDKMELYIDNNLVDTTGDTTCRWDWFDASLGYYVITVNAYDKAENSVSDKIKIWAWM